MLGDEEDFLRAPGQCGPAPLVGVELRQVDLPERRGVVVVLAALPGGRIEADEDDSLLLVVDVLLGRRRGQRHAAALPKPTKANTANNVDSFGKREPIFISSHSLGFESKIEDVGAMGVTLARWPTAYWRSYV